MIRGLFRLAARVAIIAALVWLARTALKRWVDGPEPQASSEPWPEVREAPSPRPQPATSASTKTPAPAPGPAKAPADAAPANAAHAWVEPNGTGAPASHPVKAKVSSKIYREPGMAGYEQSKPDRCYATAEAAEADGFTRAKR